VPAPSLPLLRTFLWIALAGWLGAAVLFAAVVAPAAFSAGATPQVAGAFVGRVLTAVHLTGVLMGLAVAALGVLLGRRSVAVLVLALGVSATMAGSEWGVSPEIRRLQIEVRAPDADASVRARFGRLHGISMTLFGASVLAGCALAVLHAVADLREGRQKNQETP
jgi:hypothetical protein